MKLITFLILFSSLAQAGSILSLLEVNGIVDEVARHRLYEKGSQAADTNKLLDLLGIDAATRAQLTAELTDLSCLDLFTSRAHANPLVLRTLAKSMATLRVHELLLNLDNASQIVLRDTLLRRLNLSAGRLAAVADAVKNRNVGIPTLAISNKWSGDYDVARALDQFEVFRLFDAQARNLARTGANNEAAATTVNLTWFAYTPGKMTLTFTVQAPGYPPRKVSLFNMKVQPGETAEEAAARVLTAAVPYRLHLEKPEFLVKEINALRYDLLILISLSAPADQDALKYALKLLAHTGRSRFWGWLEKPANYRGRLFGALLEAKFELLALSQEILEDMDAAAKAGPVVVRNRRNRTAKRYAAALAEAKAKLDERRATDFKMEVAFEERPGTPRVFDRDASAKAGYYRPKVVGTSDDSVLSPFAYQYDPFYMYSHPLYWHSDSMWATHRSLFEVLGHQHGNSARPTEFFQGQPSYEPDRFATPIEPKLYAEGAATPFVHAWEPNQGLATQISAPEMLGWQAVTGIGAGRTPVVDFTAATALPTEAESTAWAPASDGSTDNSNGGGGVISFAGGSNDPAPTVDTTTTEWTTTPAASAGFDPGPSTPADTGWSSTPDTGGSFSGGGDGGFN